MQYLRTAKSKALGYKFSYNLSRKYPFRWFTSFAIVVLTFLFIFFTTFNIAVNGYTLQPVFTSDPSTATTKQHGFNSVFFTWGDNALTPTCPGQDIAIGSQFFTSNKGLTYTLRSVTSQNETTLESQLQSSMSYLDESLQNCRVNAIDIYLTKADESQAPHSWWYNWTFSTATAEAQCDITHKDETSTIRFTVSYAQLKADKFDYIISDNYTTHASMWWGTRLMYNYFNGMQTIMAELKIIFTAGHLTYTTTEVESIKDYRLSDLQYWLLGADGGIDNTPKGFDTSQV